MNLTEKEFNEIVLCFENKCVNDENTIVKYEHHQIDNKYIRQYASVIWYKPDEKGNESRKCCLTLKIEKSSGLVLDLILGIGNINWVNILEGHQHIKIQNKIHTKEHLFDLLSEIDGNCMPDEVVDEETHKQYLKDIGITKD